jgi:hypothetical protein
LFAKTIYVGYILGNRISINGIIMSEKNLNQLNAPLVLVKTWCLLAGDKNEEVSRHALQMLLAALGGKEASVDIVKPNNNKIG